MRPRIFIAAAAVVLAAACSGATDSLAQDEPVLQGLDGIEAAGVQPSFDPPPEVLVETPPRNDTERLLRKSRRRSGLCLSLAEIDALAEPDPHRLDKVVRFAGRFAGVMSSFDPQAQVRDPQSTQGRRMDVPKPVLDAMATVEAAVIAYRSRVTYSQQLVTSDRVKPGDIGPWIDHAWFELVNSPYTEALDTLVRARRDFCT